MTDKQPRCLNFELHAAEMRRQAITVSASWFLWVNILFSLFILGRNYFSPEHLVAVLHHPLHVLESAMVLVLAASSSVLFILRMAPDREAIWLSQLAKGTVLFLSLTWAISFYVFIASGDMRVIFPLAGLLLFTALISLYFDARVLLTFIVPIWLSILVSAFVYDQSPTALNAVLWLLLAALLESGRRMLNSWFLLALRRGQEKRDLIKQLETLASYDPLTGIANRRNFQQQLDNAIHEASQTGGELAMIMVDVDHFKRFNDHYGHQAGDICLKEVANQLKSAVRKRGDSVARLGGEEFAILLPGGGSEAAHRVARRLAWRLENLAIKHAASPVSQHVTVSQGISVWKPDMSGTVFIAQADAALYQAKESGRNRWNEYDVARDKD
ncbi:membrane-associated sensor domain-containing protein [Atlantibacter subterranea]|uniref:diguanylate cyclase n=1 Tax=Atlantibacter subterraneus TaxID=255519 RepID=A0ABU4DW59_9ENTR|nr:membrane-associated sensor domain-containing protein [Atlantibacter subterranea]MDV7021104.1 membrane-associated sensor domain-containing protein [Atlantibacter subterranea]MDZ5664798.1 membrane-associated sensor domain-containing protein [Atlantibacter hermannii]